MEANSGSVSLEGDGGYGMSAVTAPSLFQRRLSAGSRNAGVGQERATAKAIANASYFPLSEHLEAEAVSDSPATVKVRQGSFGGRDRSWLKRPVLLQPFAWHRRFLVSALWCAGYGRQMQADGTGPPTWIPARSLASLGCSVKRQPRARSANVRGRGSWCRLQDEQLISCLLIR